MATHSSILAWEISQTDIVCHSHMTQSQLDMTERLNSSSEVAQSCPTLCDPTDCSLPGSSVHGIFQARILEWVVISFSRGSSQPRDRTQVSRTAGRATSKAQTVPECIYILNFHHSTFSPALQEDFFLPIIQRIQHFLIWGTEQLFSKFPFLSLSLLHFFFFITEHLYICLGNSFCPLFSHICTEVPTSCPFF